MAESSNQASLLKEPLLPLKGTVLLPGISLPMMVATPMGMATVDAALSHPEKSVIAVAIRPGSFEKNDLKENDFFAIGTRAIISRMNRSEKAFNIIMNGVSRVKIKRFELREPGFYYAVAEPFPVEEEETSVESEALHREALKIFAELKSEPASDEGPALSDLIKNVKNPLFQIYAMAVFLDLSVEKYQDLLEASSLREAYALIHTYLAHEQIVDKLRKKISRQVAGDIGKEQKEYFLRRQLSEIRKQLGEGSGTEDISSLEEQAANAGLPEHARSEVDKQLNRLKGLTTASPEYSLIHTHLKYIIELPWSKKTDDNLDLDRAQEVLDKDHFDLEKVKERIIEHLAVMKLNPEADAPILCFVGPPGTGKTSLGQSIARALGRVFERISLGGVHDEAELRGHRRTYIGALPGRIMEAIRRAGVNNPLIMLDEIDKLGADFRGDPAAALMEILDPEQNCSFRDNYLDLPFDLSQVFFVTTANTTENIPRPLLDRMERLYLAGYTDYEKVEIAKRYLIPEEIKNAGLDPHRIEFNDPILLTIIRHYTREAGVRQLKRTFARIARKVAVRQSRGNNDPVVISDDNLTEFLGQQKVFLEEVRKKWAVGTSTGLAWTEEGGDIIFIETSLIPKKKDMVKITGHIGRVMSESVACALTYVQSHFNHPRQSSLFADCGLHVHIPAGAIPKDGPSAGIAIAVAMVSLFADLPVQQDVAMTGEITLSGLILPVGGVKEKVLAAHRAGIRKIILPRGNEKDLEKIPKPIRSEINFVFVDEIAEGVKEAIPTLQSTALRAAANRCGDSEIRETGMKSRLAAPKDSKDQP